MSSTTKSTVSDYEHLNYKSVTGNAIGINESDDDLFFLKAPAPKPLVSSLTILNDNNNSSPIHTVTSSNQFERFGSVAVNNKIPVPSSWSPGVTLHSNPALLITPERSSKSYMSHGDALNNDHPLPSHNEKKVPQPVPWSPSTRPEKSIFISPEKNDIELEDNKYNSTENLKNTKLYSKEFSTFTSQDTEKSSKERQTVRFDLPSLSSGDDTFFDENSSLFSPVTIKGAKTSSEFLGKDNSQTPFPHTSFESYDAKSYNPHIYSDDSAMEESVLTTKRSVPQSTQSQPQHTTTNVSLSTSAHLVNKLRELMQDTDMSKMVADSQNIPTDSQILTESNVVDKMPHSKLEKLSELETKVTNEFKRRKKGSQSSTLPSRNRDMKSSEVFVIKENQNKSKSSSSHEQSKSSRDATQKAGPHFLKNSVPPYHPPSSGSCIVKEPHHNIDSQDYSYPFQDGVKETENFNEMEHAFARPEFNSTLKFRQALDTLCEQEIDVAKAVNEKLKLTTDKKTEIQEKAAHLTNCPSDQFANLVDLAPPVDRLCDRIVRMRTSKVVKKKKKPSDKAAKVPSNDPDLMEFFSPELQKEMPGVSLQGMTLVTSDLLSASSDVAFDVYRHNRVWQAIHDF